MPHARTCALPGSSSGARARSHTAMTRLFGETHSASTSRTFLCLPVRNLMLPSSTEWSATWFVERHTAGGSNEHSRWGSRGTTERMILSSSVGPGASLLGDSSREIVPTAWSLVPSPSSSRGYGLTGPEPCSPGVRDGAIGRRYTHESLSPRKLPGF